MILKASERANAANLARHLMNTRDNEHVELHELSGFAADTLHSALQEVQAIAKGTRCKNFLFSVSLSPPETENVPIDIFESAVNRIEKRLGLEGQPRAIVFHEKEGRRHAHVVWSRIDVRELKAINLPHYKNKLNGIARDLYIEHGWDMPEGFKRGRAPSPLNFTLAEWQQAKRLGHDPKRLKEIMQECWAKSDSASSLRNALLEHGYFLAHGDRRGFVVLDYRGEVFSLSRFAGVKSKDVRTRLGDAPDLLAVDETRQWIAAKMTKQVQSYVRELEEKYRKQGLSLTFRRKDMVDRHRALRAELKQKHTERWQNEECSRAARLPRGLKGLWSWVTGNSRKIRAQNEKEVAETQKRDRQERQAIIEKQLSERRALQALIVLRRKHEQKMLSRLSRDVIDYLAMGEEARELVQKRQDQDIKRDHGPKLEM
ncbi:relaxase/mobilization nuclease domain-containing protein [Pontivivens nitratireducens]|uniref:Relaxase/mobilization nuclease domain-containing protein n=1 Tax=Pontivivens nitratireducens TaxID=2758038 RepID=A0A6G7VMI2_9RHOB|nr:relaxase/mobilization nuclease domain-containing protein [Pontibrevibacter nitratireducens]QIK41058.1 relaxase/mobilization nuclease domain-containing protein [Pontibrevibacter nitratireducens]